MDLGDLLTLVSLAALVVEAGALLFLVRFRRGLDDHPGSNLARVLVRTVALFVVAAAFRLVAALMINLRRDPPVLEAQVGLVLLAVGPVVLTLAILWAVWDLTRLDRLE